MTESARSSTDVDLDTVAPATVTDHKPLRCPYCGSEFSADVQYTGGFVNGYECDNFRCDALWDKFGNPTRGPRDTS